jgi:hypothetical protein
MTCGESKGVICGYIVDPQGGSLVGAEILLTKHLTFDTAGRQNRLL